MRFGAATVLVSALLVCSSLAAAQPDLDRVHGLVDFLAQHSPKQVARFQDFLEAQFEAAQPRKAQSQVVQKDSSHVDDVPIWPLPLDWSFGKSPAVLSHDFQFVFDSTSDILAANVAKYKSLLARPTTNQPPTAGHTQIRSLSIVCESLSANSIPSMSMNEAYTLAVDESGVAHLHAPEAWGAIRGLETFSQLVSFDFSRKLYQVAVGLPISVSDEPRFPHRGILVDSARHFLSVDKILEVIESMTYAKYNVMHWHIVDAQSFPVDLGTFANLAESGAWGPAERYTTTDVQNVVEFARLRGIRVIPEFDSPGHAASWGFKLNITYCIPRLSANIDNLPLNPAEPLTWKVLEAVYNGATSLFLDESLHTGGDEVVEECWSDNAAIAAWMKSKGLTELNQIYGHFVKVQQGLLQGLKRSSISWEEVFTNFGNDTTVLPTSAIIQVWKDSYTLSEVVASGRRAMLSYGWYLDHLNTNWTQFYTNEPTAGVPASGHHLILGGEACMWGETVDASDIMATIWPRAAATAERLWSPKNKTQDIPSAQRRIRQFRCLLNQRGVGAAPSWVAGRDPPRGPGPCLVPTAHPY